MLWTNKYNICLYNGKPCFLICCSCYWRPAGVGKGQSHQFDMLETWERSRYLTMISAVFLHVDYPLKEAALKQITNESTIHEVSHDKRSYCIDLRFIYRRCHYVWLRRVEGQKNTWILNCKDCGSKWPQHNYFELQWNAYRVLVGNPEGKRPLGRPRRRCVANIKMDLREMGWDDMDWIWLRIGTSGGLLWTR
jgi:hypothetical protein